MAGRVDQVLRDWGLNPHPIPKSLDDWGPTCAGCGANEYRIDGYCSMECRDRAAIAADVREALEADLSESETLMVLAVGDALADTCRDAGLGTANEMPGASDRAYELAGRYRRLRLERDTSKILRKRWTIRGAGQWEIPLHFDSIDAARDFKRQHGGTICWRWESEWMELDAEAMPIPKVKSDG